VLFCLQVYTQCDVGRENILKWLITCIHLISSAHNFFLRVILFVTGLQLILYHIYSSEYVPVCVYVCVYSCVYICVCVCVCVQLCVWTCSEVFHGHPKLKNVKYITCPYTYFKLALNGGFRAFNWRTFRFHVVQKCLLLYLSFSLII
jgi:hypothetical protein